MIPEWERQEFVQLVFPHKNTDWACCLEEAIKTFSEIAYAIASYEKVLICYEDEETINHLNHKNFIFKKVKNN
ncbi:MAG: agmatine deiminase family protein, partial [Nautiliaceae bacterium]